MDKKKNLPAKTSKQEISIKKNAHAEALQKAPDEVIAKAIHEAILKEHEGK